ncbi:MAG: gamma-glutamyl-gamma-aminobutyrate hydrolase family protein [Candidatus Eremiobacteraeota bacterium]|nr:gamma-glutamyl-gamma-aminobutyrate hydrolase family protein [Candidatus Eremiobacteraeota bacterium]MCW5868147.1 gamma-glutamyl-gamma-aminobutyrate hydrolase family protein [Candidatus Eremiobacteraeota bacterium]
MHKVKVAILVRSNYWHFPAGPVNGATHRSVPDIMRAIRRAGGEPVLVYQDGAARPEQWDALVIPGGNDLHPGWYGQAPHSSVDLNNVDIEFDRFQLRWTRWALENDKPVLGICRGMQVLNVASGGDLVQDVAHHCSPELLNDPSRRRDPAHGIHVAPGSRMHQILGDDYVRVNSIHHQAVQRIGERFHPVAWAPDGVVEAIEGRTSPWQRGVQFHPEDMQESAPFQALFESLVEDTRTNQGRG